MRGKMKGRREVEEGRSEWCDYVSTAYDVDTNNTVEIIRACWLSGIARL
jgi:hypothetical protein